MNSLTRSILLALAIPPLTASVHAKHATVMDPDLHLTLDNSANRASCYRCHPGSATKCLRGAMGGAIARDGSMSMQCQSCHGTMSQVGSQARVGWFMEPNCQSCHSGTATSNNGQIRYTSVFETNGSVRVATNQTFATQPNTPAPGLSLYRFSAGHGGLQCSACHGSTHAEFPATHRNDNIRNEKIQGHAGVMVECTSCHASMSVSSFTSTNGPHGMHPISQAWVTGHHDYIGSLANCQKCHGMDYRGTPLSRMHASRSITVSMDGTAVTFPTFKGAEVGCYNCHNGPFQSSANSAANPTASNVTNNTLNNQPLSFALPITGAGAAARVTLQPAHGSVGVSNNVATYFPDAGFIGTDTFTFAAWDGSKNSTLATGTVIVAEGPYSIAVNALVSADYPAGWPAAFSAVATPSNTIANVSYEWNFGDGSPLNTNRYAAHAYSTPGAFGWSLIARVGTATATQSGTIVIGNAIRLGMLKQPVGGTILWPRTSADAVLENSPALETPTFWTAVTNSVSVTPYFFEVDVPAQQASEFFRLRQVQ